MIINIPNIGYNFCVRKRLIVATALFVLFVIISFFYIKISNPLSQKSATSNINSSLSQLSNGKTSDESEALSTYSDSYISFEYPSNWRISKNETAHPFLTSTNFISDCNQNRIISFTYKATDPKSMELGLKNPYGPSDQTSEILKINGITMGENIQSVGDGSGGYEPKVVVDFLSKSKNFHFYFYAVMGCGNSFEETYSLDLLPVLNSIKLLD